MTQPRRMYRPAAKDWVLSEGAVYIGAGTIWANPWSWRGGRTLARVPALNGEDWELETRGKGVGSAPYTHPDGRITDHTVRPLTRRECAVLYERALLRPSQYPRLAWALDGITVDRVRTELAGKDLYCSCAAGRPCHGDVLIGIANLKIEEWT